MGRKIDYSTAAHNGMEYIGGRMVYTGPKGYRVQFTGGEGDKCWSVFSYAGAHTRLCFPYANLTEDEAHERAASLAGTTPHPKPDAPVCFGHADDDYALMSGVGIGESVYCDGSCNRA